MPWIADALGDSESTYQRFLDDFPPQFSQHPSRPYMQKFADRIGSAALYWLSRTAATVAADLAAHGMPEVTFRELITTSELPQVGMMLWPKSLAPLPFTNHRLQDPDAAPMTVTWDGLAWIYDDTEFSTYLLSQVAAPRAAGALSDVRPAWSPGQVVRLDSKSLDSGPTCGETRVPITEPPDGLVEPTVSQVVAAVLALIGQERVVSTRTLLGHRPTKSPSTPDRPKISILDVLRPPGGGSARGEASERALRRWFVRGHWRRQPHGPGGTLRKLTYIALHTAGHPDGPEPTDQPAPQVRAIYAAKVRDR
jgi:hypothetical protein